MTYKSRPLTKFEKRRLEYEQWKKQDYIERKQLEQQQLNRLAANNNKSSCNSELDAKLNEWHFLKLWAKEHKYRDLKDFF